MKAHAFNSAFDKRDKKPASSRLKKYLNGIDLASATPSDGICHFGWSGKAWLLWRDAVVLGFGQGCSDVYWIERLVSFLNAGKASGFVDLGFKAPEPGSKEFVQWQLKAEKQHGWVPDTDINYLEVDEVF